MDCNSNPPFRTRVDKCRIPLWGVAESIRHFGNKILGNYLNAKLGLIAALIHEIALKELRINNHPKYLSGSRGYDRSVRRADNPTSSIVQISPVSVTM